MRKDSISRPLSEKRFGYRCHFLARFLPIFVVPALQTDQYYRLSGVVIHSYAIVEKYIVGKHSKIIWADVSVARPCGRLAYAVAGMLKRCIGQKNVGTTLLLLG
jgi:hypothetical protein